MPTPDSQPAELLAPSLPDLSQTLERQISAGFPPELAFDLVLHELVVRAGAATQASAAALALARGSEMVCRAATGLNAPDLGVPLNTREGLSGICLQTQLPQNCYDTEVDPLVDAEAARQLGIRSILIVPVLDDAAMLGILEVFSSEPAAFSDHHQALLEAFADDCVRLHRTMIAARTRSFAAAQPVPAKDHEVEQEAANREALPAVVELPPTPAVPRLYEGWTLFLGAIVIFAAAALSFMIGTRIGWIRSSLFPPLDRAPQTVAVPASPGGGISPAVRPSPKKDGTRADSTHPKSGELVFYDHGKVIYRTTPASKSGEPVVSAAENTRLKTAKVWLAPDAAERRLRNRVEPTYPAAALAAHSAGDVLLEVVIGEDGSVVSARGLSGDPVLTSAALDAVRQWQYEPYRRGQHPSQFQTDVTLRFSLPD